MLTRFALVVVLLSACSAAPVAETVPGIEVDTVTTATTASPPPVSTTSTAPPTSATPTTTTTTAASSEPHLRGLGLAEITAHSEGDGIHPRLVWDPVPGAATYTVLVMNPEGEPWWSWSGPHTSAVLGGVDTSIGGPVRESGVRWVVFAYDADDRLLAVSALESF